MKLRKIFFTMALVLILPGCTAIPFGLGLIPGAPMYVTSLLDNSPMAYESAMDERSTRQQMQDSIIAGHAQAELYKHKEIRPLQITAYCYFGKLYLVGEYDSQDQLRAIYEAMDNVEGKKGIISRLYLKEEKPEKSYIQAQAMWAELEAQLMADFEVTSSPLDIEVVQGNIILLGVISDKVERDRIVSHAQAVAEQGMVVSYLYHSEIAGPEARPMLAAEPKPAPATAVAAKPAPKKTKKVAKKKPRKKATTTTAKKKSAATTKKVVAKTVNTQKAAKQSVATNIPPPPPLVNGRYVGL